MLERSSAYDTGYSELRQTARALLSGSLKSCDNRGRGHILNQQRASSYSTFMVTISQSKLQGIRHALEMFHPSFSYSVSAGIGGIQSFSWKEKRYIISIYVNHAIYVELARNERLHPLCTNNINLMPMKSRVGCTVNKIEESLP